MNVWCHLSTIFKQRNALQIAGLIALCVALITTLFFVNVSRAAPGVNQTLSFQGRLTNPSGGTVPDGHYNIQFKIYQDGAGTAASNPGGTLKWTESYINDGGTSGIEVKNGYFSATLGSQTPFGTSVDWNQDTLWLSMNVAGSATACTTYGTAPCTADGEMLPMKRLTSTPYALNAGRLGGLTSSGFIQNTTSAQTADFNITGTGIANTIQGNTSVIAPLFDRADSGTLNIGTVNASTINIGTNSANHTINIGTGSGIQTVTLGSADSSSSTKIQGGSTGVRIETYGGFAVRNLHHSQDAFLIEHNGNINFNLNTDGVFTIGGETSGSLFSVNDNGTISTDYDSYLNVIGGANFNRGITVQGGASLSYLTPEGYNMSTAINIPNYSVPAYGSVLALGLPSTSNATAHGILVADGRTSAHQATIGILSPDENAVFGLSYNGSNTVGTLSNTAASVALQGNGLNLLTATNNGGSANVGIGNDASSGYALDVTGTIRANAVLSSSIDASSAAALEIGSANATSINLNQDVTVAAGKSLALTGGNTASRPASPTEGMVYYDTTTKKLLVYSNGKWQADRATATQTVAASNSSQAVKDAADYVADGTADDVEINAALTAAAGGKVYLAEGTYYGLDTINVPNNTTLAGAGRGTLIYLTEQDGVSKNLVTPGANSVIQDLRLDGQQGVQSGGTQNGISATTGGSGDGGSAVQGVRIQHAWIENFETNGVVFKTPNNAIANSTIQQNIVNGIYMEGSQRNVISDNMIYGNGSRGIWSLWAYSRGDTTINGNTIQCAGTDGYGIELAASDDMTVTGNTIKDCYYYGISLNGSRNTITNNNISGSGVAGILLENASGNTVSGNTVYNTGGSASNNALMLIYTSNKNSIVGNSVTDSACTTTCYGINISHSSATANYIADNHMTGASDVYPATINDIGTDTIYAGQMNEAGKLINKTAAGSSIQTATNNASGFSVQNAAGASALVVDTTSNTVLVAGALDTTAAAGLTIGSTNATSVTIGNTTSNVATTILGTAVFKPTTGNDSTTSFQLQRADGTAMLVADSTNQTITIGGASNRVVISTATGQITKYGTARNTKKITLNAEYTGSVLDAGTGSNNTGIMTSSIDLTNRMNYYKWTTSQGTNQNYDVVVQVPIPTDFDGWASSNPLSISTYTSDTTNGTVTLEARDSSGTVQCNFASVTPGSTSTWATNDTACTLSAGTYTAGDYMTLRIRMQSPTSGDIRIGNINLSYLSKY